MTNPSVLPGRTFEQTEPVSRLLFSWRARDTMYAKDGGPDDLRTVYGTAGTFTRSSPGGMVVDAQGRLVGPHADDLPRFEWVDTDGDGILDAVSQVLEGARTNGFTFSEQLDNAAWTKTNTTIAANDVAAPDGSITADKLIEDVDFSQAHFIIRNTPTLTNDLFSSVSFYARAGERTFVSCASISKANNKLRTFFDLTTGTIPTNNHGAGKALIEDVGSGWFRCEVQFDAESGGTTPTVEFTLSDTGATIAYNGDGVSGLHIWGIQFETDQPFASTYMPTVASTTTRNAETLNFPFNSVPQVLTAYCRFVEAGSVSDTSDFFGVLHIGSATPSTDPRLQIRSDSGTAFYEALIDDGTTEDVQTLAVAPSLGDEVELALVVDANGAVNLIQSINGGATTETGAGTATAMLDQAAWADVLIHINSLGSSNVGFNNFLEIKVAAGVQTMRQLREAV